MSGHKKKKDSRIGVITVVYYPNSNLRKNIESYLSDHTMGLIINNSPEKKLEIEEMVNGVANLEIVHNSKNMGIAYALNRGLHYFVNKNFPWVLTMDQDSYFRPGEAETFYKLIHKLPYAGIIAPFHRVYSKHKNDLRNRQWIEINSTMTSGNLLNTSAFKKTGDFEEKLFIDYVDMDYSLRLRKNGFKIFQIPSIELIHNLGNQFEKNIFGKKRLTYNHSAVRKYYVTRNRLYFLSKNWSYLFSEIRFFSIETTKILLMENEKWKKLKYIALGAVHFCMKKYGPLNIK